MRKFLAVAAVMTIGVLLVGPALAETVDIVNPGNGLTGRRIHGPRVKLDIGAGPGILVTPDAVGLSFAGASCAPGQFLVGFDPAGNPLCAPVPLPPPVAGQSCPVGQVVMGINPDGTLICTVLPAGILPRGVTLRGTWKVGGQNPAGGGVSHAVGDISFGFTFAAAPTVQFIPLAGPTTPECPGTIDAPQALPGYLCLYEEDYGNNDWLLWDPPKAFGVNLYLYSLTAPGAFWTRGTWAATSP